MSYGEIFNANTNNDKIIRIKDELPDHGIEAYFARRYGEYLQRELARRALQLGSYDNWFTPPKAPPKLIAFNAHQPNQLPLQTPN